jgi:Septum formation
VETVPCRALHNAEVFATFPATGAHYPGREALEAQARAVCELKLQTYVLDSMSLPADTDLHYRTPLESGWADGERTITCLLITPNHSLNRSLREDAGMLTADQVRFLRAVNPVDRLLDELVAEDPVQAWNQVRALSEKIAVAESQERAALKSGPWPAAVQPAVDRMIADDDKAIPVWHEAGVVDTEAEVLSRARQAAEYAGDDDTMAARHALGLTTVVGEPAHRP